MRLKLYRGRWYAVWTDESGRTRRLSLRTADKGLAARRLSDLKAQPAGDTVSQILDAYAADKASAKSRDAMLRAIASMRAEFGALRPDQVTRQGTRGYAEKARRRGLSNGTIRRYLGTLKAGLRWADPTTRAIVELPPLPPPRERFLTRREYAKLLRSAGMPHVKLFLVLALATAARTAALLSLRWAQVDFRHGLIRFDAGQTDGKRRVAVPMTGPARQALMEAQNGATTDWVIEWAGKRVLSIRKGFSAAVQRAGLEDVTPHDLRRTAATWMVMQGVPLEKVMTYLGHSDMRVTWRHYAKFAPSFLRDAARALEPRKTRKCSLVPLNQKTRLFAL